jgi:uncharacterized membrane protein
VNRHRLDPVSLVAGLLFTGLGVAFLAGNVTFSNMDLAWLWPLAVIALGVALLAGIRNRPLESPDAGEAEDDAESPAAAGRDLT